MQSDEIAEAVEKLKSEGKIVDFGLSKQFSNRIDSPKTEVSYNQVQFSATNFEPMVDGSFDYMQLNKIRPVLESVRICFQKGYSANPSFNKY
jgi:predicted oxidoreductase